MLLQNQKSKLKRTPHPPTNTHFLCMKLLLESEFDRPWWEIFQQHLSLRDLWWRHTLSRWTGEEPQRSGCRLLSQTPPDPEQPPGDQTGATPSRETSVDLDHHVTLNRWRCAFSSGSPHWLAACDLAGISHFHGLCWWFLRVYGHSPSPQTPTCSPWCQICHIWLRWHPRSWQWQNPCGHEDTRGLVWCWNTDCLKFITL